MTPLLLVVLCVVGMIVLCVIDATCRARDVLARKPQAMVESLHDIDHVP